MRLRGLIFGSILIAGVADASSAQSFGDLLQDFADASAEAEAERQRNQQAEMVRLIGPNYERAPETAISPDSLEAASDISPSSLIVTQYNGVLAELNGSDRNVGSSETVAVGAVAFAQFQYVVRPQVVLEDDLNWQLNERERYTVSTEDKMTIGGTENVQYCTADKLGFDRERPRRIVCFLDTDRDNRFDTVTGIRDDDDIHTLPEPLVYRIAANSIVASKFRRELLYLGRSSDTLRFQYQEFQTNLIRPAFTTELTYQMAAEGPTTVRFRNLEMSITSVSNEGLTYTVNTI